MKKIYSKRTKVASEEKVQYDAGTHQTRILIVSSHSVIRQGLLELINRKPGIGICIEVGSTNQSLDTISRQQIDLAIIDISSKDKNSSEFTDKIKLHCPSLPIILLSMNNRTSPAEHTLQTEAKESFVNQQAIEQIIKAIHYSQSLLRSQIFGFTIVVNL